MRPHADAVDRRTPRRLLAREAVVRPVINDDVYGYKKVNVAEQRRDPQSLLNWTERMHPRAQGMPGDQLG